MEEIFLDQRSVSMLVLVAANEKAMYDPKKNSWVIAIYKNDHEHKRGLRTNTWFLIDGLLTASLKDPTSVDRITSSRNDGKLG